MKSLTSSLTSPFISRNLLPSIPFESHDRVFPSHAPPLEEGERSVLGNNFSSASLNFFSNQEKFVSDSLALHQHAQLMLSTLVEQLREGFEGELPDHIADMSSALLHTSFLQSKLLGASFVNCRLKQRDIILDSSSLLSDVKKRLRVLSPFEEKLFPGDLSQIVTDLSKPTLDLVTQSTVSSILQAHQQVSAAAGSAKNVNIQSTTSNSTGSAPGRGRGRGKAKGRGRGKFNNWRGRGRGRGRGNPQSSNQTFRPGASQKDPN